MRAREIPRKTRETEILSSLKGVIKCGYCFLGARKVGADLLADRSPRGGPGRPALPRIATDLTHI